ncbi:MAG: OB-fold putative lipoprotein [Candidatus Adiutrix sp.]|nr:OB-fold putative lipoprotein [Candidatus Adiutrix sp.]
MSVFFQSVPRRSAWPAAALAVVLALLRPGAPALAQGDYMEPLAVTPAKLADDYRADFHRADAQYTGKLLLVTGRVRTIRPPQRTWNFHPDKIYAYITLDTGRNRPLVVYFWDWEAEKMNRIRSGTTLTVMGFCQGVTPQLSLREACVYPGGCGGPVAGFYGPYFKLPPSPPSGRSR